MVQPRRARGNFKANVVRDSTPPSASHPPPLLGEELVRDAEGIEIFHKDTTIDGHICAKMSENGNYFLRRWRSEGDENHTDWLSPTGLRWDVKGQTQEIVLKEGQKAYCT